MATVVRSYGPPIVHSDFNLEKYPELAQFIGAPPPGSTGGAVAGTAPRGGSLAAGRIPTVPPPGRAARQAINRNLRLLPSLQETGRQLNAFNLNQLRNQYATAIPGFTGLEAQSARNIRAALEGRVPDDVLYQLQTNAANFGVGSGTGGGFEDTPFNTLAGQRGLLSLGLTSLEQQRLGEQQFTNAMARAPRVNLFDPTTMFVTPQMQHEANLLASYLEAAPDPEEAYQRGIRDAMAGLRTGQSSIPTPSFGGGGAGGATSSSAMIENLINKYLNRGGTGGTSTGGMVASTTPTAPTGPGWGYAPGVNGPISTGDVPSWLTEQGTDLPASSAGSIEDWLYSGA